MRNFTQPNGTPAIITVEHPFVNDPNQYLTGTLFQETNGTLWRVGEYRVDGRTRKQYVRMTNARNGSLKAGESRWAVEVKTKAYEEGREAYKQSNTFFDNPYFDQDQQKVKDWARGWGDAQIEATNKLERAVKKYKMTLNQEGK